MAPCWPGPDRGAWVAEQPIIVLFHRDLRTADHPALSAAAATQMPVIPLYVWDPVTPGPRVPGGASKWWLHHSLESLGKRLEAAGSPLVLRVGKTIQTALELARTENAAALYFTRGYEPWWREVEDGLQKACDGHLKVKRFSGRLLLEPEDVSTGSGEPYKVYTPFWNAVAGKALRQPRPAVERLRAPARQVKSVPLEDLELLPTRPNWAAKFSGLWEPGSEGAERRLRDFTEEAIDAYHEERNRPDRPGTSRLSPHLHFGEISPAQCWAAVEAATGNRWGQGAETFLKEIAWREFSYHLLFHYPWLPDQAFRKGFRQFPWREDDAALNAWQQGKTGYPIVDAGMRQLWATGWMHNRVRMIVASFLTKNLLLSWQTGEQWFWDCLVDADLASNSAGWQWVAGSGVDAAPYFRVFNPVAQGQRFDPEGAYVRTWVPELAALDAKHIHAPWEAPAQFLKGSGVELGRNYPHPIVDHKKTRERALAAFEKIKGK